MTDKTRTVLTVIAVVIVFIFYEYYTGKIRSLENDVSFYFALSEPSLLDNEQLYVTETGNKYHTGDCQYAKNSDYLCDGEADAQDGGYIPCEKCIPTAKRRAASMGLPYSKKYMVQ